jgi:hypothetical protein
VLDYLGWIPALPLIGAIVNGLGAGRLPRKVVSAIGVGTVGIAFVIVRRASKPTPPSSRAEQHEH